jgi:thiamine monophosphate kinase
LLFTLAEDEYEKLARQWENPTAITRIGTITDTGKVELKNPDGRIEELEIKGYDHLKD